MTIEGPKFPQIRCPIEKELEGLSKNSTFEVLVDKHYPKSSAKKGKTEQPEPGEKPKMPAKVKVEGFTIEGRLKMALSDPLIRSTLLFGNSRRTDSQVEFIDSPFAKEPNRYSEFHS